MDTPSAAILVGSAVIVEVAVLAETDAKFTVVVFVAITPIMEKLNVAVAAVFELVSITVYVPSLLSVTLPKLPAVVYTITVPPLFVKGAPPAVNN